MLITGVFWSVSVIRDQLFESRNMQNIPVYVIGNKIDLCGSVLSTIKGGHHHSHRTGHHHLHPHNLPHRHHHDDLSPAFKELSSMVRKTWKCSYLECSAKYNWRIVPIFKDIIKSIEANQLHQIDHHRDSLRLPAPASDRGGGGGGGVSGSSGGGSGSAVVAGFTTSGAHRSGGGGNASASGSGAATGSTAHTHPSRTSNNNTHGSSTSCAIL